MTVTALFETVGWTIVHAIWQGTIVGLLTLAALQSRPGWNARIRYAICSTSLILMFVAFVSTFAWLSVKGRSVMPRVDSGTQFALDGRDLSGSIAGLSTDYGADVGPGVLDVNLSSAVACLWIAGVVLMSLRLLRQWISARRLREDGVTRPDHRWLEMFDALKTRLAVGDRIELFASTIADSPMVVGWISPVVLVPTSALTSLTPKQIEMILAHELLHIARRDHLVNMLQGFIEILLFFHPVTWWLSRQISIERENCCDDASLAVAGSPRSLAEALLALETLRVRHLKTNTTLAATGGSLMHRVSRLFGSNRQTLNVGWRALSACTFVTTAGLTFAGVAIDSPALAQDRGARGGKQVESDVAGDISDDKRNARIEERLRAMGADIRRQVADGEITSEEGRKKFAEAEERMSRRIRITEELAGEDRPASGDLELLKARIEVQIKANGDELAAMVEAGKISEADAKARYDVLESRLWMRYRAAEEGGTLKDAEENRNIDLEDLKAGIEKRLRAMGAKLREQVAAGEMTDEEAREKYQAVEKRMWSRYRDAEEKRIKGRRGARAGDRELEELKAGIEERLRAMGAKLREQVAAGEMTDEEAREKYQAMEKRVWSRYRDAEEKQAEGDGKGRTDAERSRTREMSREEFDAAVEKMTGMVERGEISRKDMRTRIEEMRKTMKD